MKSPTKVVNSLIILGYVLITISCNDIPETTITVINEMQTCEENNIFYRIVSMDQSSKLIESKRDSLVLFTLKKELKEKDVYDMLYPSSSQNRLKLELQGYFLEEKVPFNHSYGCPGSSKFYISKILKVENVDELMSFPIKN